jgi:GAF domain-containing protein
VAVAIASGAAPGEILAPALGELCMTTEASVIAIVTDEASPIVARHGRCSNQLARSVLEEAGSDPGIRAYAVGPQQAGDPGWAAFYVPIMLGGQRMGTLAAGRSRGEPFAESERHALSRMANLAALAGAAQRYQQQRTELARLQ